LFDLGKFSKILSEQQLYLLFVIVSAVTGGQVRQKTREKDHGSLKAADEYGLAFWFWGVIE